MNKAIENKEIFTRKGTVQFVALSPKYREKVVYFTPIFDSDKNSYIYYPDECPEPKIADLMAKFVKDPGIQIAVKHNQILNKANDKDYAIIMLLLIQYPRVVISMDDVIPDVTIGYLYDKEYAASQLINKVNDEFEAISKVHGMSYDNLRKMAFYLGMNPNIMSSAILTSSIYEFTKANPKKILEFFNDKDADLITLVNMLRKSGQIVTIKGMMYYEKTFLGSSVSEAVSNLKQDNFADLLSTLRNMAEKAEVAIDVKTTFPRSVPKKK